MHSDSNTINPYLQQEVLTASPIRLRWMLVARAEELCGTIGVMWGVGQFDQAAQWTIRVREILGELLEGVRDASNPLSKSVTDFYLFLLQLLGEVEQSHSVARMQTLQQLLGIEAETWRLVMEKDSREAHGTSSDSLKLESDTPSPPVAHIFSHAATESLSSSGFSLEV